MPMPVEVGIGECESHSVKEPIQEPRRMVTYPGEWRPYIGSAPPRLALVRFWNEYNGDVWTGRAADLHPQCNVACLWWKETGIQRIQEDLCQRSNLWLNRGISGQKDAAV